MANRHWSYPAIWPVRFHPTPPNPRGMTALVFPEIGEQSWADRSLMPPLGCLWQHVHARRHRSSAALPRKVGTRWPRNSPAKDAHGNWARPARHLPVFRIVFARRTPKLVAVHHPAANATRPPRPPLPQQRHRNPASSGGEERKVLANSCRHFQASAANKRCSANKSPLGLRPRPSANSAPRKSCRS